MSTSLPSTAAPIATGWSDPVAGCELHPLKTNTSHMFIAHISSAPFFGRELEQPCFTRK